MQVDLLNQAKELLSKAEKTTDPSTKKALSENALEILVELMEDEPTEKDIITINNVKKSFARSLASQICTMNMNDIETTKFFYFNFVLKLPKEVLELKNENAEFDKKFNWLADQFRSDLA